MITGKEDMLQSLIEVFLMEKGTSEFYSGAAAKAVNPGAKKTFEDISGWEERHMAFVRYLYQSVMDERDIKGFEAFEKMTDVPDTEAGIPLKELEAKSEEYIFTDDLGALAMAFEIEGRAYGLYRRLSEEAADSNARVVFNGMMEQELNHIAYLEKMRMRLAETS